MRITVVGIRALLLLRRPTGVVTVTVRVGRLVQPLRIHTMILPVGTPLLVLLSMVSVR